MKGCATKPFTNGEAVRYDRMSGLDSSNSTICPPRQRALAQEWVRLGPPDLQFEAISRDRPDGHAQVSLGAVAASQVPVLAWP